MKDILIVEDGQRERERLTELFRGAGYSVSACASVGEAEKELQVENFRLAILDVGLSDKSGSYLFGTIKRAGRVAFIIIFTGNPSVHLKQRFLDEGAVDYIVKASPQAHSDQMLARVREILGAAEQTSVLGIPLEHFLQSYIPEKSRPLFLASDNSYPACKGCGSQHYVVTFDHRPQLPPEVIGMIVCVACKKVIEADVE